MKKNIIPLLMLCISLNAQNPSAKEIIEKVDKNMSAESRIFTSKMVIHNPRIPVQLNPRHGVSVKRNPIPSTYHHRVSREQKC